MNEGPSSRFPKRLLGEIQFSLGLKDDDFLPVYSKLLTVLPPRRISAPLSDLVDEVLLAPLDYQHAFRCYIADQRIAAALWTTVKHVEVSLAVRTNQALVRLFGTSWVTFYRNFSAASATRLKELSGHQSNPSQTEPQRLSGKNFGWWLRFYSDEHQTLWDFGLSEAFRFSRKKVKRSDLSAKLQNILKIFKDSATPLPTMTQSFTVTWTMPSRTWSR